MIAVDTNALVYAHRAEMDLHASAADRLTALAEGDERWALPVFCVTEFLRVVTHPRVFNPPSTVTEALGFIDELLASPTCEVVCPEAGFLDRLGAVIRESDARGNLVFDAQIAALCGQHGIPSILTNDHDFERFPQLNVSYLR
ncbi:MAG: PIN domain-containing protein [Gammaproteobacteria bacterium]|nr:PIN domain-containing protein [Gammaproteobacteria bacterium]